MGNIFDKPICDLPPIIPPNLSIQDYFQNKVFITLETFFVKAERGQYILTYKNDNTESIRIIPPGAKITLIKWAPINIYQPNLRLIARLESYKDNHILDSCFTNIDVMPLFTIIPNTNYLSTPSNYPSPP